jgi:hypothetical protein
MLVLGVATAAPADAQNLLKNPDFDTDLSGWSSEYLDGMPTFVPPDGDCVWNPNDMGGSGSGCADCLASTLGFNDANSWINLHQCVPIAGVAQLVAEAHHLAPCGQSGNGSPELTLLYYENGTFMDYAADCVADESDCDKWHRSRCPGDHVPSSATSVCIVLLVSNSTSFSTFGVAFDEIKLMPGSIFDDDFESGNLSQWSGHVP